jgi:hypothetical protein
MTDLSKSWRLLAFLASVLFAFPACSAGRESTMGPYRIYPSILTPSAGLACACPNYDIIMTIGAPGAGASRSTSYDLWSGFKPTRRVTVLCPTSAGIHDHSSDPVPVVVLKNVGPNPTTGTVRFAYRTDHPVPVRVVVFDPVGRTVRHFAPTMASPGDHRFLWDGRDDNGGRVSTGVYFVRFSLGSHDDVRSVTILR